ncbi:MAG: hypothetical protein KDC34_15975 [Saprospiraceae bacterium]|nr:hypothetical protein [Saprospiraceae bacterium]
MKKNLLGIAILLLFGLVGQAQTQDLENLLFELPDVRFEQLESPDASKLVYLLRIKQPIDHSDPGKGFFYQRAFLTHVGFDRPTVMATEGYDRSRNRPYELSLLLEANQIDIEHRYFGESVPDSMDYQYLNLKQATADLHHINQLFRQIYTGKWVSTGISKGGSTTIYYRYYYPDDVDVSVPYVAPINIAFEEPRIYQFLDTIGSDECRAAILAFQRRILQNRVEVLPLLHFYSLGAGLHFTYLSEEEAFEYAVLEYPFSFWQYGQDCAGIPDESVPLQEALEYLIGVSGVDFFSDGPIKYYGSHYYQSATEMGYYGYETDDFKDLLQALPLSPHPYAAFMPDKMPIEFDGTLLRDVNKWIKKEGNHFIYINGAIDTWSASAVPPTAGLDAVWFFLEGKHHASARIQNMTPEEQQKLITTLEKWLSMDIDESLLNKK